MLVLGASSQKHTGDSQPRLKSRFGAELFTLAQLDFSFVFSLAFLNRAQNHYCILLYVSAITFRRPHWKDALSFCTVQTVN